ncbi:hypothetical protein QBC37DRAFT_454508, partial [Rhypophila decipiens]
WLFLYTILTCSTIPKLDGCAISVDEEALGFRLGSCGRSKSTIFILPAFGITSMVVIVVQPLLHKAEMRGSGHQDHGVGQPAKENNHKDRALVMEHPIEGAPFLGPFPEKKVAQVSSAKNMRQLQKHKDVDTWETNRMLTSGVAQIIFGQDEFEMTTRVFEYIYWFTREPRYVQCAARIIDGDI